MEEVTQSPVTTMDSAEEEDDFKRVFALYFILAAIIFGLLLFIAIRKTVKLCFSKLFYGEPKMKPLPEEGRRTGAKGGFHPASMFKAPSLLHKLQERYDHKNKGKHDELASRSLGRDTIELDEERGEASILHQSKERPRLAEDNFKVPKTHVQHKNEANEQRQAVAETILTEASIEPIYATIKKSSESVMTDDTSDLQSFQSGEQTTDSSQEHERNCSTDTSGFVTQSDTATLDMSDVDSDLTPQSQGEQIIPSRVRVSLLAGMFSKAEDEVSLTGSSARLSKAGSLRPHQNTQSWNREEPPVVEAPVSSLDNPSPMRSMVNDMGGHGLLSARANLKKTDSPRNVSQDIDTDSLPSVRANIFLQQQKGQQASDGPASPRSTYSDDSNVVVQPSGRVSPPIPPTTTYPAVTSMEPQLSGRVSPLSSNSEISSLGPPQTAGSLKRVSFDTQPPTPIHVPEYFSSDRDSDDEASRTTDQYEGFHSQQEVDSDSIQSEPEGSILDIDAESYGEVVMQGATGNEAALNEEVWAANETYSTHSSDSRGHVTPPTITEEEEEEEMNKHDDDVIISTTHTPLPDNITESNGGDVSFQRPAHFAEAEAQYDNDDDNHLDRTNSSKYGRFRKNEGTRQGSSHRATKSWNRVWKGVYEELSD